MRKKVFIMSKAPFQGLIKNRLSKEIGYRKSKRLVTNAIEKVNKIFLRKKKEYSLSWYILPCQKFRTYSFTISKNTIIQPKGNLGHKMWNLLKIQNSSSIIVGSDIPSLNIVAISLAFEKLRTADVLIGPTYDGGFWLIGYSSKKKHPNPFNNIRWSTKNTLSDLVINLKKMKISYDFTCKLRDIDNKADYCENK